MTHRMVRFSLVLLAIAAILAGGLALTRPVIALDAAPQATLQNMAVSASRAIRPDSLLRLASERAPFRAARVPPRVRFDPADDVPASAPPVPSAPRPVLVLSGIVWGPEPTAVLEGIPGVEGSRVVRRLDRVGDMAVRSIQRDRVVVTGLDTTWTLHVKEPWK